MHKLENGKKIETYKKLHKSLPAARSLAVLQAPNVVLYTAKFPAWKFQVAVQFTIVETNIETI